MSNTYNIKTIADILSLTRGQQKNYLIDLDAWLEWRYENMELLDAMKVLGFEQEDYFTWVDDDRLGEISGISISIAGEV